MTLKLSPSTRFNCRNFLMVKQLKPFRDYDARVLDRLLESAWTKLGGKNKQYYVNDDAKKSCYGTKECLAHALKKMKEVGKSEDDAFEIYRTEMRLILLQDPVFVKDHYHELQDVIKEGWKGLRTWQRTRFYQRAVLPTEDDFIKKAEEKQIPVIRQRPIGDCSQYFDRHSIFSRGTEWTFHDYKMLTSPYDNAAFEVYANVVHADEPSLAGKAIWRKWMALDHEERESYYRKAFETAASVDADLLFLLEKQTIDNRSGNDHTAYHAEQTELRQAWNDASDEVKKVYIDRALKNYLEKDQNPETRFVGLYNNDKDKLMARVTTVDDVDSELTPQLSFSNVKSDKENYVFPVYMEKMRPDLLKQPKMIQKRFWEVNVVLLKQWRALSEEEQQPYYDLVRRFLQVRTELNGWQVTPWNVYSQGSESRYNFAKLDAEAKKRYGEIALQNRKILLKKFPDLDDYYLWITPVQSGYELDNTSKATSSSPASVVEETENSVSHEPNTSYIPKYDYFMYSDVQDMDAFKEYRDELAPMISTMVSKTVIDKFWWPKFVKLTDEERNVYYDRAFKALATNHARALFAEDNCTVIRPSENLEAYADEIPRLNEVWKTLSVQAKNYYIELAEKALLKREKEKPEDHYFESIVNFCDIELDNIPSSGYLVSKYLNERRRLRDSFDKKAFTVYLKKHFTELYNQPGMADKRYFQLSLILEQRFMNLSAAERQIYFDIVELTHDITSEIQNLPVRPASVFYKKHGTFHQWDHASHEVKAVCEEEAKQNLKNLMEKFPTLTEHFHWIVYRQTPTKSQAKTSTNAKIVATEEPTVFNSSTEEPPKETEPKETWEVVNDTKGQKKEQTTLAAEAEATTSVVTETVQEKDNYLKSPSEKLIASGYTSEDSDTSASWEVVKDKTLPHELEGVKIMRLDLELGENVETLANTSEPTTDGKINEQKNNFVELDSVELQKPLLNASTSEESESDPTWEVIDDKKNTKEAALTNSIDAGAVKAAVPENEPQTGATSTQATKTPTAFMFYKKAMRRLNADQNFGKKENDLQRKALIEGWKKLTDEEKAVYLKMENSARAEAQLLQLL